ncbi:hypothetical protein DFR41_104106 [Pseudacidovorax intermedius]|uniref:Uncharacterized protein n=1 Tax=Pseudacidovorax intermedius TaxID=433924 RepID=A0A370FF61_9BURK|nr:hypothetical protein [Pseudacidovorax intermedius]RDI25052.1 hypothetical protein DFR41_104106 [Pseudacidovorax intermedius]
MQPLSFGRWEHWMLASAVVMGLAALAWRLWDGSRAWRQRHHRIDTARSRSGTLAMPLQGGNASAMASPPAPPPAAARPAPHSALYDNPHPTLRIQYTDIYGQASDRVITVERLDLYRQVIVARGTGREDLRTLSIGRIRIARDAGTGAHFSLGQWIDRMRSRQAGTAHDA